MIIFKEILKTDYALHWWIQGFRIWGWCTSFWEILDSPLQSSHGSIFRVCKCYIIIIFTFKYISHSFDTIESEAERIWRYHLYGLVHEYYHQPWIPPPLSLVTTLLNCFATMLRSVLLPLTKQTKNKGSFTRCDMLLRLYIREWNVVCDLWWFCSHGAMNLDAICNVLTLEMHVAITQNGCGTYSCAMLHTSMHHMHMKSHHVNSVINIHTTYFMR